MRGMWVVNGRLFSVGHKCGPWSIIHIVAYADDVVRVSVDTIIDPDAEIPYGTSEIQYVKQALDTFVAWPTHLVKVVLDEVTHLLSHT